MVSTMAARSRTHSASWAVASRATATMESTSSSKVFMIVPSPMGPRFGSAIRSSNVDVSQQARSKLRRVHPARVNQAEHQCDGSHQNEAEGPGRIQIEPAPRYEFEAEIAVDQPRQTSAGRDHRAGVDDGDLHGHAEIGIDE